MNRPTGVSVARGFAWNLGSTAIPIVTAFIVSFLVARWLGPGVLGTVSLTMAIATTFLIVAKFGIDTALSKLLAEYAVRDPTRIPRLLRSGVALRLLFTTPMAIAAYLSARPLASFYDDPSLVGPFRAGALLVLAVSFYELFNLALVGLERFTNLFAARLLMFTSRTLWIGGVLVLGGGAASVLLGYAVSSLLPALLFGCVLLAFRPVPGVAGAGRSPSGVGEGARPGATAGPLGELARLAAPLALSTAAVTIYGQMDRLMLGYFWGAEEVGQYSLARNVMETSLFPIHALNLTLLPVLSGAFARGDRERCRDLVRNYLAFGLFFGGGVILVLGFLATPLVTGLYGTAYEYGAGLLPFFMAVLFLRVLTGIILPMLLAAGRAGSYAALTLLSAGVNFGGNLLLVPSHQARGAVWATALSYVPVLVLGGLAVSRSIGLRLSRADLLRYARLAASALAVGAGCLLVAPAPGGLPGAILWALLLLAVYAVTGLLVRAVRPSEVQGLWSSLRSRGHDGH